MAFAREGSVAACRSLGARVADPEWKPKGRRVIDPERSRRSVPALREYASHATGSCLAVPYKTMNQTHRNKFILAIAMLTLSIFAGCADQERVHSHEPLFTLPFDRSIELTVWETGEDTAWMGLNHPELIVAPQDGNVLQSSEGAVRIGHHEVSATMLIDDLDEVFVRRDKRVCAGDVIAKSQQLRVRAHYGWSEFGSLSDMSLIRVIRNSIVTDMSDMRPMDQVHSALGQDANFPRGTDVNSLPCIWEDENEWSDADEYNDFMDRRSDESESSLGEEDSK
jgi:hypothetical protein